MKLKNQFSTIRARIVFGTVTTVALISTLIIVFSHFFVSTYLQRTMIQTSETRLSLLCSTIDSNITTVNNFLRSCQLSQDLTDFALEKNPANSDKKLTAHEFMTEILSYNNELSSNLIRIAVLGNNRDDIIQIVESPYSSSKVSVDAIRALPYFYKIQWNTLDFSTKVENDPFLLKEVHMIPFIHPISHPYQAQDIGYIYSEMSVSVITEPIKSYISGNESRVLFHMGNYDYEYANHTLSPYQKDFTTIRDLSNLAINSNTQVFQIVTDSGEEAFLITCPLTMKGWFVTEYLDAETLYQNIFRSFFLIVLIIVTFSIIICKIFSSYLSKVVNVPVKKLQERMHKISAGDFSRDASVEWDHELGEIGKNINDLSENVLSLINQKIDDERQKKDYEYKMLQSQINPHFLYNTLNSIKWMATIQNAPGIAEMTTALSRLLKDISKGQSTIVSISHELKLLNDYFTIQSYRYGGAIKMTYEIEDEALTECQIPKFTLQPIVENAIFHGIEPKGSAGTILIHIYEDENTDVHIDITDDGVGIEKQAIEKLLQDDDISSGSSFFKEIGVSNVNKRLQYEFPGDYGLKITSELGCYTTVSIVLPKTVSNEKEV
ncbi:MAG: sensor histidine kinase [Lachnospiraceae bacterium]|nr:sensor histidine kinase [Lachnospiraceae bacterium]